MIEGTETTLTHLVEAHGEAFVGSRGIRLYGRRFPLLVKLIDAADWLSLQVHPSDDLARRLYGPAAVGKTEAWLILDADPAAELVTGPSAGLASETLRSAIADGSLGRGSCEVRPAVPGDLLLLRAGTLHAIGAGVLVYEVEQPSDLTFRVSDWGRPQSEGRRLHPEEALQAVLPDAHAEAVGRDWVPDGGALIVDEFRLEVVAGGRVVRDPAGASVDVVTCVRGEVVCHGDGWAERLDPFETLVVPARMPSYTIDASASIGCVATVP